MSRILSVIRTFLGHAEEGAALVAETLGAAVAVMAQHGTKAPVEEALSFMDSLSGTAKRERALREGAIVVAPIIAKVRPGRHTAEEAGTLAAEVEEALMLAVSAVLTAKVTKAKATPAETIAKALASLAKVKDKDLAKALRTPGAGADLVARVMALHAANEATKALRAAGRVTSQARKATAPATPATAETLAAVVAAPATAG